MRTFVAIPLPEPVTDRLEALADALPAGRKTPRENLHLTLAFLGDVREAVLEDFHLALSEIRADAVGIDFGALDLFGGSRPQVVVASVGLSGPLAALQGKIAQAARGAGVALRRERYRPHVTLARFNRAPSRTDLDRLTAFLPTQPLPAAPSFVAVSFGLFRSDLGHGPARHEMLATYPLDATAAS